MRSLGRRLAALEEAQGLGYPSRWHWIVREPGETGTIYRWKHDHDEFCQA